MEHICAQGFHVFDTGAGFKSPLTPFLQSLTDVSCNRLSGNGWCLPVVAAWMLYVWSNCVRREQVQIRRELRVLERGSRSFALDAEEANDSDDDRNAGME